MNSFIWVIVCLNCGPSLAGHRDYSDQGFGSIESCEENARGVALNLHMMSLRESEPTAPGKDYGYKCFVSTYQPKRIK